MKMNGTLMLTNIMVLIYIIWLKVNSAQAFLESVRIEETPFGIGDVERNNANRFGQSKGIHAISRLKQPKGFFFLFHVPYIVCFFAAKGKWPLIPPFMQNRVDNAAKAFFNQNDSSIKNFCQKYIAIKECFRPIFNPTKSPASEDDVEVLDPRKCKCEKEPIVFFDRDHIGNVSADTILSTIEFLESFLPPPAPTKKPKRKIRVKSRVDDMDID